MSVTHYIKEYTKKKSKITYRKTHIITLVSDI